MGSGDIYYYVKLNDMKQQATKLEQKNENHPGPVSLLHYLPCADPCVPPPPPLEGFIGNIHGYNHLSDQPSSTHACQTPLPVYHSSSYFPHDKF